MTNYNLGLVSVSFRRHSPIQILSAMKETKLSCIEWGSDIHAPCKDVQRLHELAELQRQYNITCCSYGTYFRLGTDDINELEDYAAAAKILGTDILRIWCGDKRSSLYSESEKQEFLERAKNSAILAQKLGVKLCMECHNNSFTETLDGALTLMETVNSRHFRMYWQPNQFVNKQTNIQYIQTISPYVENVHVFNWQGNNKYPLSQSVNTWKEYLSRLAAPRNLLLEFMPDDKIESLTQEAKALCQIIE